MLPQNDGVLGSFQTVSVEVEQELRSAEALTDMLGLLLKHWCETRGLHGVVFKRLQARPNYRTRFIISLMSGDRAQQIAIGNLERKTLDLRKCSDRDVARMLKEFFEVCDFRIVG